MKKELKKFRLCRTVTYNEYVDVMAKSFAEACREVGGCIARKSNDRTTKWTKL